MCCQRLGCPFSDHGNKPTAEDCDRADEIADPETTTPNGCTCTSLCATSIGAGNFGYDWCHTSNKCGEYSPNRGYWDKCQYLNTAKPDYTALSWEDKQKKMWTKIVSDNSIPPYPNLLALAKASVKTSYDNEWDVMPAGREKFIHSVGVVCPFVVNIVNSPFTGILKTGETHGLIRLGSAQPVGPVGVTPGGGVKFFRSGRSSGNFVILNKLGPMADKNYNFFAVPLSNHIPEDVPKQAIAGVMKFCQAQPCVTKVGLSALCTYDQEGNKPDDVVLPFKVSFPII